MPVTLVFETSSISGSVFRQAALSANTQPSTLSTQTTKLSTLTLNLHTQSPNLATIYEVAPICRGNATTRNCFWLQTDGKTETVFRIDTVKSTNGAIDEDIVMTVWCSGKPAAATGVSASRLRCYSEQKYARNRVNNNNNNFNLLFSYTKL
jgi:hypothetical protein